MAITRISLSNRKPYKKPVIDPFFEVKELPLIRSDGVETDLRALVNGATNRTVGTVSKRYKLFTHQEASNLVKNFLAENGFKYESKGPQVSNGGSRFFETIIFPEFKFNPIEKSTALDGKNIHVDDLIPAITVRNSYDKTSPIAWDYGMYRVICQNGMAILKEKTSLSFRHTQVLNTARVKDALLNAIENSIYIMENVAGRLNQEDGSEFLVKLLQANFSASFKEKLLEKIAPYASFDFVDREENGKKVREIESIRTTESAWAVYNVATEVATHVISNRSLQELESKKIARVFEITA